MRGSAALREVDVAVLGAGPTGLGAAWRLEELRRSNALGRNVEWALFERERHAGGLARSEVDARGFRWDLGGHVIFSHYAYFDAVLARVLEPTEWLSHVRERWVRVRDRWLPYPVQRNLHRLPIDDLVRCVRGLIDARDAAPTASEPRNFAEWTVASFGEPLNELFFAPFNRKMWATEPSSMSVAWTAGRSGSGHANVPTVDLARLIENVLRARDDLGWNADQRFPYPREGGTGAIWDRIRELLPPERLEFGAEVASIRPERHELELSNGERVRYGALVSAMPLDLLVQRVEGRPEWIDRARGLRHTCVQAVGLGFEGETPDELRGKCWLYLTDPKIPAYRATVLSTYSPNNVPKPGAQWSLLLEVATSQHAPREHEDWTEPCEAALRAAQIVGRDSRTLSRWQRFLPRGYPIPTLDRDERLLPLDAELRAARIWSRGRFGGWKYEVSNLDHSFQQGVEAVDAALLGAPETTWPDPDRANAGLAPLPKHANLQVLQT